MSQISEEIVLDALRQIIDPDLRKDIVTLGFIRDLKIDGGDVSFRIVLTTPACPVKEQMEMQARELVGAVVPGMLMSGQAFLGARWFDWARGRAWRLPRRVAPIVLVIGAGMFAWPLIARDPITNYTQVAEQVAKALEAPRPQPMTTKLASSTRPRPNSQNSGLSLASWSSRTPRC